jgi:hypothetical protein
MNQIDLSGRAATIAKAKTSIPDRHGGVGQPVVAAQRDAAGAEIDVGAIQ